MLSDPDLKIGHLYRFIEPNEDYSFGNTNVFKIKEVLNEHECRRLINGEKDLEHLREIRKLSSPNRVDSLDVGDEFFVLEIGRSFYDLKCNDQPWVQYRVMTENTIGWMFINKCEEHIQDITELISSSSDSSL